MKEHIDIQISKDVRGLHVCTYCGKLGQSMPKLYDFKSGTTRRRHVAWAHPRCILKNAAPGFGLRNLVNLPEEELGKVRLCDVDEETMRAILDEVERRYEETTPHKDRRP